MIHSNTSASILINRRSFLKKFGLTAAALAVPELGVAALKIPKKPRALAFDNLHTGEQLALTYFENGRYVTGALEEINQLLRDHRTGAVIAIDPKLIDLLYELQMVLGTGSRKPFQIISGYRSPETNEKLHKLSNGVAKKSLHMQGKAIDIRLEGIDSAVVKKAAIALYKGGVGYYPQSDFVHLDTGRVRYW